MPKHARRHGFTLVEMSVVLVVIGLIVGGLMGTRAYLKSAQYTTMMNQSKYYITAYNQFLERYKYPPGDLATASSIWSTASNGDGNGLIRAAGAANTVEVFLAFQHLSLAGYINGNYSGATTGGVGTFYATAGTNVPPTAVKYTAVMLDHPDTLDGNMSSDTYYFDGIYNHVLRVAGLVASTNGLPSVPFLTPENALGLDSKFDDGVPNQGWITTPNQTALANCSATSGGATTYKTANAYEACYFILRIQ